MSRDIPSSAWDLFSCPNCNQTLEKQNERLVCTGCKAEFGYDKTGSLDLRINQKKTFRYDVKLCTPVIQQEDVKFSIMSVNPDPEVDFSGFDIHYHLSEEILSHFPKAKSQGSVMLDLGCGDAVHRNVCEHAGYDYVGIDYYDENAPIFADAHALPFMDNSFDFILSIAVLEHIRFPAVMMKEAHRVLKPNGLFLGTVAFLEPFHGDSFYHHSHLGTYNSLQEGGFKIKSISPNAKWTVLDAQANMGLFPQMPNAVSKAIIMPVKLMHKLWWKMGELASRNAAPETRVRNTTGSFAWIAEK